MLKMPLINCEINPDRNWSENCFTMSISVANRDTTFSITDTKLYVPVASLWTQVNAKLLGKLKSGFKRKINCKKYQEKNQKKDKINI